MIISRYAYVLENRPIYRRIGRDEPQRAVQRDLPDVVSYSPTEADRIWRITRQTAEGTCLPTAQHDVDTSGWDAA